MPKTLSRRIAEARVRLRRRKEQKLIKEQHKAVLAHNKALRKAKLEKQCILALEERARKAQARREVAEKAASVASKSVKRIGVGIGRGFKAYRHWATKKK